MGFQLGLDFGTGGIRVGIFDPAKRRTVAIAEETYPSHHPRLGWAEQSPHDWWEALGRASRRLMAAAGHPVIDGIAVATTASTVVVCRRNGQPLRPALLWMDCRAGAEATRTGMSRHPVMAQSGGSDAAEWLVPKAMWLAAHEPAHWTACEIICECLDWVNFQLSGRWVASRMNASCKWNWNGSTSAFHPELYEEFGVAGLERRLPSEVIPVGGAIGRITPAAAAHLGLPGQPLLAQGGIDAHIGMVGADVIDPGKLLMIGGTSVVHLFHLAEGRPLPGFWGPYPHALLQGLWLVEGGQVSAGSVLSWWSRTMFGLDEAGTQALIAEAMQAPVDSAGLLMLDYFMGNRTPYRDANLRGAVLGLTLGHSRAAIFRAAVESVALASANVVAQATDLGVPVHAVVCAGGIVKNPLWLRATVDALGLPVERAAEENLTIVGCAAAAGTALGLYPDLRAAAAAVVTQGRIIEPDMQAHAIYQEMLGRYRDTTSLLAETLHGLSQPRAPRTMLDHHAA